MHELSLTRNILETALTYARRSGSERVHTVVLRLGVLRDAKREWIERYFGYLSRGTEAEGAEILIVPDPIVCRCESCCSEFGIDLDQYAGEDCSCPSCSSRDYTLVSGTKFVIEGIEVS